MRFNTRPLLILLSASSVLMLSACALPLSLAAGAGATAGIAAAKEGGVKAAISDTSIKAAINHLWFQRDVDMFSKLGLTVENGRVLITGVVQSPTERVEAVRLAWQANGVKQVINEIQIGKPESFASYATDKWISGQLRTRIVLDPDIQSINYTIDTVQGVVYLMGAAQSQDELDRVVRVARRIKGVKQVVSYVKMTGEKIIPSNRSASLQSSGSNAPTSLSEDSTMPSSSEENMVAVPITPRDQSIQTEKLSP